MGLHDFAKNVNPVVANNILDEVEKARDIFGEFELQSFSAFMDDVEFEGIYENGRIGLKNITGDNAMKRLLDKAKSGESGDKQDYILNLEYSRVA